VLTGALVSPVLSCPVLSCGFELLDCNLLEEGFGDVVGGNGARLGNGAGRRSLLFRHGGG
jgi:hypothetical protein